MKTIEKFGCQSMTGKIEAILIKRPEQAFISQENLNNTYEEFCYFGCPDYEKVIDEYNAFEKIIKDNVENVYYLPQDDRTGLDSIYAHDPLKITKKEPFISLWEKNFEEKNSWLRENILRALEYRLSA